MVFLILLQKILERKKKNFKKNFFFAFPRQGRPSKMSDELTTEVKFVLHNLRVSDGAVNRKTVIAIENGVLKGRCSEMFKENGGSIRLSTKWARGVLKSLDWVKRPYATSKREMNLALNLLFYLFSISIYLTLTN